MTAVLRILLALFVLSFLLTLFMHIIKIAFILLLVIALLVWFMTDDIKNLFGLRKK